MDLESKYRSAIESEMKMDEFKKYQNNLLEGIYYNPEQGYNPHQVASIQTAALCSIAGSLGRLADIAERTFIDRVGATISNKEPTP